MKQIYIKCLLIASVLIICTLPFIPLIDNIETFDNSKDTTKILYIIRSIPKYYDERLNMQFKTWMKHLNENDDVLVASENKDHIDKFNLKYSTPTCPPGHDMGVCCSESNAIVKALKEFEFDWAFILDDDVYVYPDKVRSIINKYKDNYNVALGTPGCESNGVEGFCGGGGYAFSKQALQKIVSNDYDLFLKEYKISCEKTKFCDITMGELSKKNNIEIIDIPEFKPWGIDKDEKQLIINNKIATLHYYGGDITKHKKTIEGKMTFLQSLYSQIKEMFTSVTERFTNTSNNNKNMITTLICTSPHNRMDKIHRIVEAIESLKLVPLLYENPIIICFDGGPINISNMDQKCNELGDKENIIKYNNYKYKVKQYIKYIPNCSFVELQYRGCLTNNLKNGIINVKTKYINIMQHDLKIIKSFNITNILNLLDNNNIDLVRYAHKSNKFNQDYYHGAVPECVNYEKKYDTFLFENQPYTYCNHYSDNNHISTLKLYKDTLLPLFKEHSFPEYTLECSHKKQNLKFVYYGDINDGFYIEHTDGRGRCDNDDNC